jgi:hypothetical protein
MAIYSITLLNIFEEQVFDDTSYTICSMGFIRQTGTNKICYTLYPHNTSHEFELTERNNYMIGGEIYYLRQKGCKYGITRMTCKNKHKKCSNILAKYIDNNCNKIKLSYDDIYIDETPHQTARTYASLLI